MEQGAQEELQEARPEGRQGVSGEEVRTLNQVFKLSHVWEIVTVYRELIVIVVIVSVYWGQGDY